MQQNIRYFYNCHYKLFDLYRIRVTVTAIAVTVSLCFVLLRPLLRQAGKVKLSQVRFWVGFKPVGISLNNILCNFWKRAYSKRGALIAAFAISLICIVFILLGSSRITESILLKRFIFFHNTSSPIQRESIACNLNDGEIGDLIKNGKTDK